jgi:hypothetical protein
MESLRNLLNRAKSEIEYGWLYLPSDHEKWTLDTVGVVIDVDSLGSEELNEDDEPIIAIERNLVSTLDSSTIEDIVSYAGKIGAPISDELLFESFVYYFVNDAFLPERGFKPLPIKEAILKMDRDFYQLLGSERSNEKCRIPECNRGTVEYSVFCRVHHFENVKKKPCPFND